MEKLSSRKNQYIAHVRQLASDSKYRSEHGEYVCDGLKTLREALTFGAQVSSVLWKASPGDVALPDGVSEYVAPSELFDYASPMKNSPGPLFTVKIPQRSGTPCLGRSLVLENVQDPGNVGTVIRTANAFGISAVILVGDCADLYNPKTVRATMGAIFRQKVLKMSADELFNTLKAQNVPIYAAALSEKAGDIRNIALKEAAVAIGSEGNGLSWEFIDRCNGELIIPMNPNSESLNAAIAASVVMWEMAR